jgi:hypothetical protein
MVELTDKGDLISLDVEGHKTFYTLSSYLDQSIGLQTVFRSFLLSTTPSYGAIVSCKLFDFDYTLECYLPAHKRVYGYFCLLS